MVTLIVFLCNLVNLCLEFICHFTKNLDKYCLSRTEIPNTRLRATLLSLYNGLVGYLSLVTLKGCGFMATEKNSLIFPER